MAKRIPSTVIVFKVALKDRKKVWRRIAVRSDQTFDDLHEAIFEAFDRYDEHLYSFYFPPPGARGRDVLRDSVEYTHPYSAEEGDPFSDEVHNAAITKLGTLDLKAGQKFLYLFDFGDSWWHDVTVESVGEPVGKGAYPRLLAKAGKSPKQYPDFEEG